MRAVSVAAFLAASLLFVPARSSAQSLAEIAAKEKEKKKGKQAKVYTEDDLRRAKPNPNLAGGEDAAAATPAEGAPAEAKEGAPQEKKKEKTEEELRAEQETGWRQKLQKAREDVTRLSAEVDRLQGVLNDTTVNIYSATRTNALSQLEQTKQQLAAAQQAVTDLEDEGRRRGYR